MPMQATRQLIMCRTTQPNPRCLPHFSQPVKNVVYGYSLMLTHDENVSTTKGAHPSKPVAPETNSNYQEIHTDKI